MVNNIHKKQIETLYTDVCTVWGNVKTQDPKSKITKAEFTKVYEDVPCRMSFGTFVRPAGDEVTSNLTLSVVLFLSPEYNIKAGSEFEVKRNVIGSDEPKIVKLKNSAPPYIYPTHQEITCSILEDYA